MPVPDNQRDPATLRQVFKGPPFERSKTGVPGDEAVFMRGPSLLPAS
jgi:hypothetical protein